MKIKLIKSKKIGCEAKLTIQLNHGSSKQLTKVFAESKIQNGVKTFLKHADDIELWLENEGNFNHFLKDPYTALLEADKTVPTLKGLMKKALLEKDIIHSKDEAGIDITIHRLLTKFKK